MLTFAIHVVAGTVSLDEAQPLGKDGPAPAASAAPQAAIVHSEGLPSSGRSGAEVDDNIDLGEAGKLVRMLDGAARNRAAKGGSGVAPALADPRPSALPAGGALPPDVAARVDAAARSAAMPIRPDGFHDTEDATASSRRQVIREGTETYSDPNAGRGVMDQASPERRNAIREIVATIKAVVSHPLTWVLGGGIAIVTLAISAAGRRSK
jgi:hypothetical protein